MGGVKDKITSLFKTYTIKGCIKNVYGSEKKTSKQAIQKSKERT